MAELGRRIHVRQSPVPSTGQEKPGARDDGTSPDAGWTETQGPDRPSLAAGVRAARCGLVVALGNHLDQTECPPRIGSGSTHKGTRDNIPALEKPRLLLRCRRGSWTKRSTPSDGVGHTYGTSQALLRPIGRSPGRYARHLGPKMRRTHLKSRKCGSGSVRRIGHDTAGGTVLEKAMGRNRVETHLCRIDKTQA